MATSTKFLAVTAGLFASACAHTERAACPTSAADRAAVEAAVHAFYDALRKEDRAGYRQVTTQSFYSFDVGRRYAGLELMDVVRDARARGVQLNWSVGPIDTHVGCGMAWAAWENIGSAGIPPQVVPVRWLESAALVRQNGVWRIDFFHSTRAAAAGP